MDMLDDDTSIRSRLVLAASAPGALAGKPGWRKQSRVAGAAAHVHCW
jgi:hypothetical protein